MSQTQKTREGFRTVDSVEEARAVLDDLEHEETMLKSVVQGDGMMAGHCDEIRRYGRREDRVQVQPPLIGSVLWADIDEVAQDIYEKQLPIKVVEWESRFASFEEGSE